LPFNNRVADGLCRAVPIDPVAEKVPVAGSYNSAEARKTPEFSPPATRTLPLESRVDVCPSRAVPMDPVAVHVAARAAGAKPARHAQINAGKKVVVAASHANCLDRSLCMPASFGSVLGGHHARWQVTDW
jgi:hypothetical protein